MRNIVDIVLENDIQPIFNTAILQKYFDSYDSMCSCLKRAVQSGKIIRLKRNNYILNRIYRKKGYNLYAYISLFDKEAYLSDSSVLSMFDLEMKNCSTILSVSQTKTTDWENSIGWYVFTKIKQKDWKKVVVLSKTDDYSFYMAKPLKALCDYVIRTGYNMNDFSRGILHFLEYSLRSDMEEVKKFKNSDFEELRGNYPAYPIVDKFLNKLESELNELH